MSRPAPRGWLERNWPWVLPAGCLTLLLLLFGAIALVVALAFSLLRGSDVYQQAVGIARGSPVVIEHLGTPVEPGWLVRGSINTSGASGHAELALPLSGPRADATLYIEARRRAGQWEFRLMVLELDGDGRRFDLLEPETAIEPESLPPLERE